MHEYYVPQAHMEVLNSRWYREMDPDTSRDELVTKQYRNLCAVVERVMDVGDSVARNLFRSCVRLGASSTATLDLIVKSQKRSWLCDVSQHSQFGLVQSGGFVPVGSSRTPSLATHTFPSSQRYAPTFETHEYQVCESR